MAALPVAEQAVVPQRRELVGAPLRLADPRAQVGPRSRVDPRRQVDQRVPVDPRLLAVTLVDR